MEPKPGIVRLHTHFRSPTDDQLLGRFFIFNDIIFVCIVLTECNGI